jgi:ribosomal protein L24E
MKKLLCTLTLALFCLVLAPQQAQAQYCSYGVAYGSSWTWQSGSSVYFYSSTELDYCAGLYYDPATWGRYSEGNWATESVRMLGEGYTEGYADWIPAVIEASYAYPYHNQYYNTDTRHYVLEYYQQYYCFAYCGYYWYDPWGWGFAEGGGYGGPSFYGYGGAGYWQVRRRRLGDTWHTIQYVSSQCQQGMSFDSNGNSCPLPTPTPTPAPTPTTNPTLDGPSEVTRDGSATFTVRNASDGQASDWKFVGGGATVSRGGSTSVTWSGKLVVSGTVSVTVNKDGQVFNLQKDVTVKARSWAFQAKAPRKVAHGTVVQGTAIVVASPDEPKVNTELGVAQLFPRYSFTPGEVGDSGPNHGFKYLTEVRDSNDRPGEGPTEYVWALAPWLEDTTSEGYGAQCGNYNASTKPNGFISGAKLLDNVIQHESGRVRNSHYNNYVVSQDKPENNLGVGGEQMVAGPSVAMTDFTTQVRSELDARRLRIYNDTAVEQCGESNGSLDGNCVFQGNINSPPYTFCDGDDDPFDEPPPDPGCYNWKCYEYQMAPTSQPSQSVASSGQGANQGDVLWRMIWPVNGWWPDAGSAVGGRGSGPSTSG